MQLADEIDANLLVLNVPSFDTCNMGNPVTTGPIADRPSYLL